MSQVSLNLLKTHVRADEYSNDDTLLQHYLDAAEAFTLAYTHRTSAEMIELGDGTTYPVPVVQAILLLAGDWYNNREDSTTQNMRPITNGFRVLVFPYRSLTNDFSSTDDSSTE